MSTRQELPEPLLAFDSVSDLMAETLAALDAFRSRYAMELAAGRILPNTIEALRIELTYHSNAIEGNTLSLRDTQLVIEGHAPSGGKSMRELYEARNHDRALRTIEKWVLERPERAPLSEGDLREVHGMVLDDIDPASAGQFRTERVLISGTGFVPPGSQKFGAILPKMIELANRSGVHPVIQATELHYNVAAVHPFIDGNGRTARLMMNYMLLRHGYWHTIIDVAHRAEYLSVLDQANTGRFEPFAVFIARCVEQSHRKLTGV
jgi:Fic family protein